MRKCANISPYMTLQLLHSEFPYIWGKFDFLLYQCTTILRDCKTTNYSYVQKFIRLTAIFRTKCTHSFVSSQAQLTLSLISTKAGTGLLESSDRILPPAMGNGHWWGRGHLSPLSTCSVIILYGQSLAWTSSTAEAHYLPSNFELCWH